MGGCSLALAHLCLSFCLSGSHSHFACFSLHPFPWCLSISLSLPVSLFCSSLSLFLSLFLRMSLSVSLLPP